MVENENQISAFSKENKIYIRGGLRTKSSIILKKNNNNQFFYFVFAFIVLCASYKIYSNKK